ncbi:NADPH-dependent F420 reductase [Paenibacillus sp. SI8]|uniref:NADPH-dependent F420 reductase n=1 Tax=unclassified Paenibacillus TaxID=185978 RepID=UPI003466433D
MKISVIGTGRMGKGLVNVLSPFVQELMWGSRSIEKVTGLVKVGKYEFVKPVELTEALQADMIIHSLWFRDLQPWAAANKTRLAGKILVDIANPFTEDFNAFTLPWGTSAAEEMQRLLPHTTVVGAFKNTFYKVLEEPIYQDQQSDIYVTGDDESAKKIVMDVFDPLPFRVLDGGGLINNRTIERMTLFERELAIRYGCYPYISFRMFGI